MSGALQRVPTGTHVGSRIGPYVLMGRLARGGMAEVHLARERGPAGVERLVALKVILPHMAEEQRFVSMFLNEARVAATLNHPNIASVFGVGEERGEPYLVMEFVHGRTVQGLLRHCGSENIDIPLGCALEIVIRACSGLHYAHERRDIAGDPLLIVHRDVSPSNLMVRFDGSVKLLDFGIAKAASQTSATAAGVFKGKPGYMSPEQCADEPLDRRSDIFNLGILLYELTTSSRAFFGDNPVAVINKIANAKFTRPRDLVPGYPAELEAVVVRAMDANPENRFETAQAVQEALESFARTKGLDVSGVTLAKLMTTCFGDEPYPAIPGAGHTEVAVASPVDAPEPPTLPVHSEELVLPRSKAPRVVGAALAVGLAGLGITWLASDDSAETPGPVATEAKASQVESPTPTAPESKMETPDAAGVAAPSALPSDTPPEEIQPAPDTARAAAPEESSPPAPRKTAPRNRRRKKSSKTPKRSDKPRKGPEYMWP